MNEAKKIARVAALSTDSEKVIERRLVRAVTDAGGLCLKFTSMTQTGYPDRLILMPGGRCVWVELKSKGCKPRRIQQLRIDQLQALGFQAVVIDSVEQINQLLNEI